MKTKIYKIGRYVLLALVVASILHAFIQSALPPETSVAESNKVGEIIEEIIPPETKPGTFVQKNLRKLAHFTEFFMMGAFVSLYVVIYWNEKSAYCIHVPFGMLIGFFDESIQILSKRGPSVTDVWIDTAGYLSASAIVFAAWYLALLIRRIYLKRRKN